MKNVKYILKKPYKRFFLMFVVPCIISVAALIVFLILSFVSNENYLNRYSQMMMRSYAAECETKINSTISSVILQITDSMFTEVLSGVIQKDDTQYLNDIENIARNYPEINSLFIYSESENEAFYKGNRYSGEEFFNSVISYDLYNEMYWRGFRLYGTSSYRTLLPDVMELNGNKKVVIPVVIKKTNNKELKNSLVINFDIAELFSALKTPKISQNSKIFIFNRYNEKVFGNDFNPSGYDFGDDFYKKIIEHDSTCFKYTVDSGRAIINSYSETSSLNGYTYFSVTPYIDLLKMLMPWTIIIIVISFGIMFIAICTAVMNARRVVKPIEDVFDNILRRQPGEDENLMITLKNITKELYSKNTSLSTVIPIARVKFLNDFLNGEKNINIGDSACKMLYESLPFKYDYYAVVAVEISFTAFVYDAFDAVECSQITTGIHELINELFSEKFITFALPGENGRLSVILNSKTDDEAKISDVIDLFIESFKYDCEAIRIKVGKSRFYKDTEGLKRANREAVFSLEDIDMSVLRPFDDDGDTAEIDFDEEVEKSLFDALMAYDTEKARKLFEEIAEKNSGIKSRLKNHLYHKVLNVIMRMMSIKNIPYKNNMYEYEIYADILTQSPEKIHKHILEILEYISVYAEENKTEDGSDELFKNIMKYVNYNYTNPMLSLEAMSSHFDIAKSNISVMFKKKLGIGFHEYISGLRIKKAKAALVNTKYKIEDICEMCGFSSTKTFFRVFKNEEGITPGEYRKRNRK